MLNMGPHSCIWGGLQLSSAGTGVVGAIGMIVGWAILTQYQRVTDRRADGLLRLVQRPALKRCKNWEAHQ